MTISGKDIRKLAKASALSHSNDPKDQDRARARKTDVDYKDLIRQLKAKRKKMKEENELDEKFARQYKDKSKLGQSSQRKSLGRGASIKDGAKKSGYESKKEHRDTSKKLAKYQTKGTYNAHLNTEAKVEKGYISNLSKAQARNERRFGKKGSTTPQGYFGQKPSQAAELSAKRTAEHKARRGVKEDESFTIDKSAHKSAQKKAKLRNLAKGNTNPNEKAAAEKKAGGPKLIGEKSFADWKKAAAKVLKKKDQEKKPQKAMDAGARLRRKKQRQEYAAKISGSEDNVPDEMRD